MTGRALFHKNIAEVEPARVRREEGWVNLNITFITEAITGFGDVCLFRATFPPGAAHQRHIHANAVEFFYVISGRGASGYGAEEHEVSAGSIEMVEKGAVHWLRNVSDDEPIEVIGGYLAVGSLDEAGYEPVETPR
ncbi:MAG TPA: cupin domain-containing protein [Candidatus Dormibacteraeota bacterium]|jgi:quercetin dioxygenase-like cupin family protein